MHTSDGTEYAVNMSQTEDGFRAFGDLASGKPRVFVIGDSFTQATDVSDDKTYYTYLKASLSAELFAYGGSGYGSLQEFMILDRYFDVIKPDLVIWQYAANDFINNSPELEIASAINNNGLRRPYLVGGRVQYIFPKNHAQSIGEFALRYCRVCYMLLIRYDRFRAMVVSDTVEFRTSPGESARGLFLQSVAVTDKIMGMVRRRVGSIPIAGFIVSNGNRWGVEYGDELTNISERNDIVLFDVESAILTAEKRGRNVRTADGSHWNDLGNRIAGQALIDALRRSGLLQAKPTRNHS
jgi:hypothetical protein